MLGFLLELQGGLTNFFASCVYGTIELTLKHYVKVKGPPREDLSPRKHNVIQNTLALHEKKSCCHLQ